MTGHARGTKRKRDDDDLEFIPRVTYTHKNRSFERLFQERSLEELHHVVRKKLGLDSTIVLHLVQLRDGRSIDLEDDEDFAAFRESSKFSPTLEVRVTVQGHDSQHYNLGIPRDTDVSLPKDDSRTTTSKIPRESKRNVSFADTISEDVDSVDEISQGKIYFQMMNDVHSRLASSVGEDELSPKKRRKKKNKKQQSDDADPNDTGPTLSAPSKDASKKKKKRIREEDTDATLTKDDSRRSMNTQDASEREGHHAEHRNSLNEGVNGDTLPSDSSLAPNQRTEKSKDNAASKADGGALRTTVPDHAYNPDVTSLNSQPTTNRSSNALDIDGSASQRSSSTPESPLSRVPEKQEPETGKTRVADHNDDPFLESYPKKLLISQPGVNQSSTSARLEKHPVEITPSSPRTSSTLQVGDREPGNLPERLLSMDDGLPTHLLADTPTHAPQSLSSSKDGAVSKSAFGSKDTVAAPKNSTEAPRRCLVCLGEATHPPLECHVVKAGVDAVQLRLNELKASKDKSAERLSLIETLERLVNEVSPPTEVVARPPTDPPTDETSASRVVSKPVLHSEPAKELESVANEVLSKSSVNLWDSILVPRGALVSEVSVESRHEGSSDESSSNDGDDDDEDDSVSLSGLAHHYSKPSDGQDVFLSAVTDLETLMHEPSQAASILSQLPSDSEDDAVDSGDEVMNDDDEDEDDSSEKERQSRRQRRLSRMPTSRANASSSDDDRRLPVSANQNADDDDNSEAEGPLPESHLDLPPLLTHHTENDQGSANLHERDGDTHDAVTAEDLAQSNEVAQSEGAPSSQTAEPAQPDALSFRESNALASSPEMDARGDLAFSDAMRMDDDVVTKAMSQAMDDSITTSNAPASASQPKATMSSDDNTTEPPGSTLAAQPRLDAPNNSQPTASQAPATKQSQASASTVRQSRSSKGKATSKLASALDPIEDFEEGESLQSQRRKADPIETHHDDEEIATTETSAPDQETATVKSQPLSSNTQKILSALSAVASEPPKRRPGQRLSPEEKARREAEKEAKKAERERKKKETEEKRLQLKQQKQDERDKKALERAMKRGTPTRGNPITPEPVDPPAEPTSSAPGISEGAPADMSLAGWTVANPVPSSPGRSTQIDQLESIPDYRESEPLDDAATQERADAPKPDASQEGTVREPLFDMTQVAYPYSPMTSIDPDMSQAVILEALKATEKKQSSRGKEEESEAESDKEPVPRSQKLRRISMLKAPTPYRTLSALVAHAGDFSSQNIVTSTPLPTQNPKDRRAELYGTKAQESDSESDSDDSDSDAGNRTHIPAGRRAGATKKA